MHKPSKSAATPIATSLMPISVDVDLVRFEKNLLQIGFFGANDARDKNRNTRRVEQVVVRNGNKIKVAAEFRGSEALGLPSTTDRDKFIALLKIISEERAKTGAIANPVRFSGYRLIQELGLSRNGEIYEEILRWGKRMTDTTITSEQVVYRAEKKVYSDETLHVFRAFRRTGTSNLSGSERQEHYEVVLEDWLYENLNQRYVIPEDFNAYKMLTRPTAKGIFGNLHLWFHASSGKPIEKDYADLCNLLNVQMYPHVSKIKSTMGLALNELVAIKYISKWDVQKMSSKDGFKIVLVAGEELLRVLGSTRPERRVNSGAPLLNDRIQQPAPQLSEAEQVLNDYGVLPSKATALADRYGSERVLAIVEYLAASVFTGKRKAIGNPAGFIIYSLEHELPIPDSFIRSKQSQLTRKREEKKLEEESIRLLKHCEYAEWVNGERNRFVRSEFSERELDSKIAEKSRILSREDRFRQMPTKGKHEVALQIVIKELSSLLEIPSFEQWSERQQCLAM